MFVFEGNGIVPNLNNEAKDKRRYPFILVLAVITVISFYLLLSNLCYFTYRGDTLDYVTANLPINGFTIFLYILFSINAITSYPIQILCAFEIIEDLKFF
jgi:amino acid permease